jgi:hypothetical protein
MPKNIEDIITPEKKRSIRNIPIPKRPAKIEKEVVMDAPARIPRIESRLYSSSAGRRRRLTGKKGVLAIALVLILIIFGAMAIFDGATLAYMPKTASLSFNDESFTAQKTGETGLLFSVVKLSGDKGISVPASGEEQIERKASGTIVVYNKNASAQRLIENTRFETPDGKVYRIAQAINIPTNGSIEAVVFANQAGEAGNIGLTDFTVPGLKGTPRYTTIYARSKTPMAGGFIGKEKKVSAVDLDKAKAELVTTLKSELAEQARVQVPEEFILIPSLSSISYEDLPQANVNSNNVTVNMRGNFYAVMFKKSDLAAHLASKSLKLVPPDVVEVPDFESLEFSFNGVARADLLYSTQISFKVKGASTLVWRTDEKTLKQDLAGRKKSEVPAIMKNYPSIREADAVIRPFWKSTFPKDVEEISVRKKSAK